MLSLCGDPSRKAPRPIRGDPVALYWEPARRPAGGTALQGTRGMTSPIARLAHFSDLHVTVPRYGWRREDWFNKRLAAWLNLRVCGRGYRFRHAEEVLRALAADLRQRRPDHRIFSGDASA